MFINLKDLKPHRISKNLRGKTMLIYGPPGCGKTTFATSAPKSLLLAFEIGYNALDNIMVAPITNWEEAKNIASQLCRDNSLKEQYETIIVDTTSEAWNMVDKYTCNRREIEDLGDEGYGKAYKAAEKELNNFCRDLNRNGYGVIFIAHEKIVVDENNKNIKRIMPDLSSKAFSVVNKMVDNIAYIKSVNCGTVTEPNWKRMMVLRDETGLIAVKSRHKFITPYIELGYDNYVNALYEAIDAETKENGTEATDEINSNATLNYEELITEAKEVWGSIIQLQKGEEATKILEEEFGKPTRFSEVDEKDVEKLSSALIRIKQLI